MVVGLKWACGLGLIYRDRLYNVTASVNLLTEAVALGKPPQLIKLTETVELEKSPR
jgi:hypothetical protein